jgi:hypothetical protein
LLGHEGAVGAAVVLGLHADRLGLRFGPNRGIDIRRPYLMQAIRQQVIAALGRIDELQPSGQLERLLRPGARFAAKAILLDAVERGESCCLPRSRSDEERRRRPRGHRRGAGETTEEARQEPGRQPRLSPLPRQRRRLRRRSR